MAGRFGRSLQALLLACAPVLAQGSVQPSAEIGNSVPGCFTISRFRLVMDAEPVVLRAGIGPADAAHQCPCKSALFGYSAFQKTGRDRTVLQAGQFTTLGKESVVLPIAVQRQLIFPRRPVRVEISCAGP